MSREQSSRDSSVNTGRTLQSIFPSSLAPFKCTYTLTHMHEAHLAHTPFTFVMYLLGAHLGTLDRSSGGHVLEDFSKQCDIQLPLKVKWPHSNPKINFTWTLPHFYSSGPFFTIFCTYVGERKQAAPPSFQLPLSFL